MQADALSVRRGKPPETVRDLSACRLCFIGKSAQQVAPGRRFDFGAKPSIGKVDLHFIGRLSAKQATPLPVTCSAPPATPKIFDELAARK